MTDKISILKFALKYFYPSKHHEIDGVEYKSKREMYREWFDSSYINGSWYIGEEIDPIVTTITREINEVFYMINGEYRYYLGFRLNHFTSNQSVHVKVKAHIEDNDMEYNYTGKLLEDDKKYVYLPLDEEITPDNITMFSLEASMIVENHIEYSAVERITVNNPQTRLIVVNKEEYDIIRKTDTILQRPKEDIQVMRFTTERNNRTYYGLRIRHILPPYYDEEQLMEYEVNINESKGSSSISDTVSVCCYSNPMSEAEVIITVKPYERYGGYKVKLLYDEINGRSYINPNSIEYIVE